MRTRPLLLGGVVVALLVYGLLLWAATTYDASVDRRRSVYEDRAALAQALHDDAEASGDDVGTLSLEAGQEVVLAGEPFMLGPGATASVERQDGSWCVSVSRGGLSTGWRCWDDGEDPARWRGRARPAPG